MSEGLEGVVAASTRLSQVDGEAGRLTIAGYAVDDLAPAATFEEVAYLLLNGRLPERDERARFARDLEQLRDGRLIRPQSRYIGPTGLSYDRERYGAPV
jgi:citrate synthase